MTNITTISIKKVLFSLILSNKKTKCRNLLNFYFISEHPNFRVYCLYLRLLVNTNRTFCRTGSQNLPGKLGQQSAICWNSFSLFRDYGLNHKCFWLLDLIKVIQGIAFYVILAFSFLSLHFDFRFCIFIKISKIILCHMSISKLGFEMVWILSILRI